MEILVKKVSIYHDVTISHNNVVISLGLYDKTECKELAQELIEAAYQLDPDTDLISSSGA